MPSDAILKQLQDCAHGMHVPRRKMGGGVVVCRSLHILIHNLGKNVRSHLDQDPYRFKVQEVLGTWDFAVYTYVKEAFKF
jgi:hypothetical protein